MMSPSSVAEFARAWYSRSRFRRRRRLPCRFPTLPRPPSQRQRWRLIILCPLHRRWCHGQDVSLPENRTQCPVVAFEKATPGAVLRRVLGWVLGPVRGTRWVRSSRLRLGDGGGERPPLALHGHGPGDSGRGNNGTYIYFLNTGGVMACKAQVVQNNPAVKEYGIQTRVLYQRYDTTGIDIIGSSVTKQHKTNHCTVQYGMYQRHTLPSKPS